MMHNGSVGPSPIGERLWSPTPSGGIFEIEASKSTQAFFKEMNHLISTIHTLTPTQRFEKTSKALRDMQVHYFSSAFVLGFLLEHRA